MEQEFFVLTKTVAASWRHVNRENPQISVKPQRLLRVGYDFTPMPEYIEQAIDKPYLERLFRILLRFARRGVLDPSIRRIASAMGKSMRTVQRYIRALVALGKLVVVKRRRSRDRNDTNLYSFPTLQMGVGDKVDVEKRGEVLKTSTTPRENPRVAVESRLQENQTAAVRMREWYDTNGKLWAAGKLLRLQKALERNRNALRACVGMAPTPTVFDPVAAEAYWKRERERERSRLEKIREAR
jgi:hypothetical protein